MDTESGDISRAAKLFELRLLGRFELLHRPSGEIISVSSHRIRALFTYLAVTPRGTETRRTLAALLWANKEDDLARQSLRQLLSKFRRSADPRIAGLISGDEAALSLDCSSFVIDRTSLFEVPASADTAALVRAADCYCGEFATGVDIDELEFDNWLQNERLHCREMAIRLFDRLVRSLIDANRHEEALVYANRLAELDPLREETHRLVIAQEAAVSGRASAMARFEQFRLLLKEELGVRPEAATLQLLETLRQTRNMPAIPDAKEVHQILQTTEFVDPKSVRMTWRDSWRPVALAVGLAVILLVGALVALREMNIVGVSVTAAQAPAAAENHVRVVFAPFNLDKSLDALRDQLRPYEDAAKGRFAENPRLLLTDVPVTQTLDQLISEAQAKHALYILNTDVTQTPDGPVATVFLYDVRTDTRIFVFRTKMSGNAASFGRFVHDKMYSALMLDYARALSRQEPASVTTLFWQATVDAAMNGNRTTDLPEFREFEAVLATEPDNIDAVIGLARGLVERAARDQSTGLNRIDDISRAARLLQQARHLEATESRPLILSKIAFIAALINKLEGRFPEARADFKSAFAYDPSDTDAAAQAAHLNLFLGHIEEAYTEMEDIHDLNYSESAFIAAETALMAGHPDRARFYYDRAVSTTPDIPRNYAWRAIALWRLHLYTEAYKNAQMSQEMKPAYRAYWISHRTPLGDKHYRDARDLCAKDFAAALSFEPNESNSH